jgi:DNA-binding winged helix-turn-helix (wHTH) protein/predicted ATPase
VEFYKKRMISKDQRVFPPFRLDAGNAQLWRKDEEIALRRKTFEVLRYLVEHPGRLVTKDELLDALWGDVTVGDTMPAICVGELRKVLGDGAQTPRFIETVHGRGYRFIAKVTAAAAPQATPNRGPAGSGPSPIIVGREVELQRLHEWFAQAREGGRQVVFVSGEPGIGKTTFLRAFLDSLATADVRIGRGQCIEQYGSGEPYMPVLEALARLGQEPEGEHLVEILKRLAPSWLAQMPALLGEAERQRLTAATPGVTQLRMLREMADALEAMAVETPLVVFLEDLHWSDFSTLELISAIARRSESARLMLIGTYRPVEMLASEHPLRAVKHELELHRHCKELALKLLSETDVAAYLVQRFADDEKRSFDRIAPAIHQRTEGNPLFMVNVVDYLMEQEALHDPGKIEAPRTLQQMIERNLDRLSTEEQRVLEAASVAGVEFSAAAVAAALERPVGDIERCCAGLSRREQFVTPSEATNWPDGTVASRFRFHHALYGEVLYDRVPASHRVELHRRIAEREENAYGERAQEIAAELAHHYACAHDKNKAIQHFTRAGRQAVRRSAHDEAIRNLNSAIELLRTLPDSLDRKMQELSLQLMLGPALVALSGWGTTEVERNSARARELCTALGDPPELFEVSYGAWILRFTHADMLAAKDDALMLLARAEEIHDPAMLGMAHGAMGMTLFYMGEARLAAEHLRSALSLDDPDHPLAPMGIDLRVAHLCYLAWALIPAGYPEQALQSSLEAVERARTLSHPHTTAFANRYISTVRLRRREWDEALEVSEQLFALCSQYGLADFLAGAIGIRGTVLASRGYEEGIPLIEQWIASGRKTGLKMGRPLLLCLLAEVCIGFNQFDKASEALDEALTIAENDVDRYCEAETHRLRGELLLRKSEANRVEAETCFVHATEIARQQSDRWWELRAMTSLARLLRDTGRCKEARKQLAKIYNWFTEGFDLPDLRDAKAVLDELSDKPGAAPTHDS